MRAGDLVRDLLQTAFRLVPWPTEAGLRAVGAPDASSPVLVTGNYDLTVRRVIRALEGCDAWLVVASSHGINVWCAASGGHLSTHQVVTALRTSGVAERVGHRRAVLPQLAATGVRAVEVSRRCGWKVRFGPVYAEDLPVYLEAGVKKNDSMRRVHFSRRERSEMAAAWATPLSFIVVPLALWLQPAWCLPLLALTWLLAFGTYHLYDRLLGSRRVVLALASGLLALAAVALAGGGGAALIAAPICSVLISALLSYDLAGSSPTEATPMLDGHRWHIELDRERCQGVYSCWEVCPEACFEKGEDVRKVDLTHDERCIRCGACVVQCPMDALYFVDEKGARVEPEQVRRFKLNLLGRHVST
jgi:NAD-dependent dihydropyrimidine dehydrogenase PreA subunit